MGLRPRGRSVRPRQAGGVTPPAGAVVRWGARTRVGRRPQSDGRGPWGDGSPLPLAPLGQTPPVAVIRAGRSRSGQGTTLPTTSSLSSTVTGAVAVGFRMEDTRRAPSTPFRVSPAMRPPVSRTSPGRKPAHGGTTGTPTEVSPTIVFVSHRTGIDSPPGSTYRASWRRVRHRGVTASSPRRLPGGILHPGPGEGTDGAARSAPDADRGRRVSRQEQTRKAPWTATGSSVASSTTVGSPPRSSSTGPTTPAARARGDIPPVGEEDIAPRPFPGLTGDLLARSGLRGPRGGPVRPTPAQSSGPTACPSQVAKVCSGCRRPLAAVVRAPVDVSSPVSRSILLAIWGRSGSAWPLGCGHVPADRSTSSSAAHAPLQSAHVEREELAAGRDPGRTDSPRRHPVLDGEAVS